MSTPIASSETILVVGGGISGMTAAVEAAECGKDVILIEKRPALGGRVAQLYKYFPKLCRPSCGQEINQRRIAANPRLRVITMAELTQLRGAAGNYTAEITVAPRYVNANCTACGDCARAVTATIDNPHNFGRDQIPAAYLPHNMAWPHRYVIDPSIVGTEEGEKAKAACKYDAVDLDMREETLEIACGAVIFATGWRPYDAAKIQPYGYGRIENVVTSVEFERMMDPFGPTGGKLLRPSDGAEARDIAFIQCAGSRDRNHLPHCSRICCMASLKQTAYLGEKYGGDGDNAGDGAENAGDGTAGDGAENAGDGAGDGADNAGNGAGNGDGAGSAAYRATIYYIDIRTIDRFEDFERQVRADPHVHFVKSKVASIERDPATANPVVNGVDTHGYRRYATPHDLVVLAVGMQPGLDVTSLVAPEAGVGVDSSGFIELTPGGGGGGDGAGIFGAGCATNALDVNRSVQSATAAALRAIQVVNRVANQAQAPAAPAAGSES
ncbi:MAG: FAD-dependent oxidoreductase [Gammaproteobacteria bacterium]|nr:FAD-dependent oxidoreductase [Gammaproteobacteria bacterium]